MLNNIKISLQKVRKSLVYLELNLRNAYLCHRFQMKGLDCQQNCWVSGPVRQCSGKKSLSRTTVPDSINQNRIA